MSALIDLLDVGKGDFILVTGPPGAGKSTLTCKSKLYQLLDRGGDCISVVTEQPPTAVRRYMAQLDARFVERETHLSLNFVDAYRRTVGLRAGEGFEATCSEPTSVSIAISDALKRSGRVDLLLTLDSLTPIYFLNGGTTVRFVQTVLARYAAEGFRVLTTIDEGVAKAEDLTAIMSLATGILRIRKEASRSFVDVLKHPTIKAPTIEFPLSYAAWPMRCRLELTQSHEAISSHYATARTQMPDYVHLLWLQLAFWGGILWDPRRFPSLVYEIVRDMQVHCLNVSRKISPWYNKLLTSFFQRFTNFNEPKGFSRLLKIGEEHMRQKGMAVVEYLKDRSIPEEQHIKHTGYAGSWGFPNVGRRLCIPFAAGIAGAFTGISGLSWNVYETQCIGSGSEYCELVAIKGRPAELEEYISGMEYAEIESAFALLIQRSVSLTLQGKDEMVRPTLGSDVHLSVFQDLTSVPALSNERYMTAMRLLGAHTGKWLAKELLMLSLNHVN